MWNLGGSEARAEHLAQNRDVEAGPGLLTLFLCGYTTTEFLADDALVAEISRTAPKKARRASA